MRIARWLAPLLAVTACNGGEPPDIFGLSDQTASVGMELVVHLDGADPDGDNLIYGVKSDVSLQDNAMLTQEPSGMGVFRWTPTAEDLGMHLFDFTVSDGDNTTTVSITIDVVAAVGSIPIFRQPLGTGRAHNLATDPCVMLDIVVEDSDTAMVDITDQSAITGAMFNQTSGTTATWRWCPTAPQVAAQDRYTLVFKADDGDNPPTTKMYVLVFNSASGPSLVINELEYDNLGTDTIEFIEIFNKSTGTVSLAGLQMVLVNGATNTVYQTIELGTAMSLTAGQYLVIAGPSVTIPAGAKHIDPVWTQDQIQNGSPDGVALVDSVTHTVLDAVSYEGSITAVSLPGFPAPVSLVEGTAMTIVDSNTEYGSPCRSPNGTDTNNAATDWAFCPNKTAGAPNQ